MKCFQCNRTNVVLTVIDGDTRDYCPKHAITIDDIVARSVKKKYKKSLYQLWGQIRG